jgi:photosystem II stability/assembly factor-like uncharacterized protein
MAGVITRVSKPVLLKPENDVRRLLILFSLVLGLGCCVAGWFSINQSDTRNYEPVKQPSSHFFKQRAFPVGKIDIGALATARLETFRRRGAPNKSEPQWQQRGPYNIQGRVTDIGVDPSDENIAYAAAAEGGIFRTLNGGATWTPLFDDMPSLSMGAVALDPQNPDVVLAGTGEVNPGGGSVAYGGTGIYRSADQGETWIHLGLENSGSIGRIVVHPTDANIIHVAVMGHLWEGGTDRGVYRTDNGGVSWSRVLFVNQTTGCVDIIQRPDNPNVLFAAMWQRIRGPEEFDYGGTGCGVYRSDDGGLNWSLVANGLPGTSTDRGRIGLAICHSNPDVMCAIYADRTGFFDGLFRTTNGGTTWTQTNDGSLGNAFASYGWWFGNVRIHPQDPNTIFVVGFDVYRSTNGGGSYNIVGSNMHVDHHGFAFGSASSPKMYCGNDGGVYTSTNGSTWTKTTGDLPITQAYRIANATWNTDALWIGAQDNGTSQDLNGDGDFASIFGGDGFQPLPHLTNPNRIWAQYQYGNVVYSSNGGSGFSNATSGLFGRNNWNAPHAQDPNDAERRYFGTDRIFRNNGNTSWVAISNDLTGGPHQGNSGQVDGTLTTIAVSPADSDVIWTGSDDGFVHVTQNGGSNWTNVSTGLPVRWITSVHPHPTNAGEALVTVSGFRWSEDISHTYHTENFGSSWAAVDGDLPDIPVNDVLIDPLNTTRYIAATDVGVFHSLDAGATWMTLGVGLPNVVVTDFAYQPATRELFAGTYGRSIFSVTLDITSIVVAEQLNVLRGRQVGGDLVDTHVSDDSRLEFNPGLTLNSKEPPIRIEFVATLPLDQPSEITFTLESRANTPNIDQQIELFNFVTGFYEQVDLGEASIADSVVEYVVTGDITRFVEAGSGETKARLSWKANGILLEFPWTVGIDHVFWTISE